MNEIWYSKQWGNAPMPHSIFFMKDGHAIHGSNDVKNAQQSALAAAGAERDLGKPASNGCVRLLPENAATLYMRNPTQSGQWFRRNAPPIPTEVRHPFRLKPATVVSPA